MIFEFLLAIGALIALFLIYAFISTVLIRLVRHALRLPLKENARGQARAQDFLFGKPLNKYERRERKGRLRL